MYFYKTLQAMTVLVSMTLIPTCVLTTDAHAKDQQSTDKKDNMPIILPFELLDDRIIFLEGTIGERKIKFMFDTGIDTTRFPSAMKLTDQWTGEYNQGFDSYGEKYLVFYCSIPKIKFGDFVLSNYPAIAALTPNNTNADVPLQISCVSVTPLLGNSAFYGKNITIDYERKVLEIGSRNNRKSSEVNPWSLKTKFDYNRESAFRWDDKTCGRPMIEGYAFGQKVRILVDTGWVTDEIGISSRLYNILKKTRQFKEARASQQGAADGRIHQVTRIEDFLLEIGHKNGYQFRVPALIMPDVAVEDVVIGISVLRHFRLTLDYPHREILWEPYEHQIVGLITSTTKQEDIRRVFTSYFQVSSAVNSNFPPSPPPGPAPKDNVWCWYPGIGWRTIPKPTQPSSM